MVLPLKHPKMIIFRKRKNKTIWVHHIWMPDLELIHIADKSRCDLFSWLPEGAPSTSNRAKAKVLFMSGWGCLQPVAPKENGDKRSMSTESGEENQENLTICGFPQSRADARIVAQKTKPMVFGDSNQDHNGFQVWVEKATNLKTSTISMSLSRFTGRSIWFRTG